MTRADAEAWDRQVGPGIPRGVFVSRTEAENAALKDCLARYKRVDSAHRKGASQRACILQTLLETPLGGPDDGDPPYVGHLPRRQSGKQKREKFGKTPTAPQGRASAA